MEYRSQIDSLLLLQYQKRGSPPLSIQSSTIIKLGRRQTSEVSNTTMNCPNCNSKTTNKFPNRECQNTKCGMIQRYTKHGNNWLGNEMKVVVDSVEYTLVWHPGAKKIKCNKVEGLEWQLNCLPNRVSVSASARVIIPGLYKISIAGLYKISDVMELPLVYGWNADKLAKFLVLL